MKKMISLLLALVLCFGLCACGTEPQQETTEPSTLENAPGTAKIDDCIIEITDCKAQINSMTNEMIAVVWVDFTNNSDQAKSLFFTAKIRAFQNGIEIKTPSTWWPSRHGIDKRDTDQVLPGYSLSTGYAFSLDDTSPVLIQICKGTTVVSEITFNI